MRNVLKDGMFIILLCCVYFLLSCAGTQEGVTTETQTFPGEEGTKSSASEEEEVLRLLGLTDDETETTTAVTTKEEGQTDNEWKVLEDEISRLTNEVDKKDKEMASLKERLETQDETIEKKQQDLQKLKTITPANVSPISSSFQTQYDQALELYNDRQYDMALKIFDQLLASGENNSLVDNCQYWKGECYYGKMDYNQAIIEFNKVFTFVNANKLDDAQLKLGLCHLKLGNQVEAKNELEKLLSDFPDSEYVPRAQSLLSGL